MIPIVGYLSWQLIMFWYQHKVIIKKLSTNLSRVKIVILITIILFSGGLFVEDTAITLCITIAKRLVAYSLSALYAASNTGFISAVYFYAQHPPAKFNKIQLIYLSLG